MAAARLRVLRAHLPEEEEIDDEVHIVRTGLARCPTRGNAEFPQATSITAFPPACHDLLDLDALLSPAERDIRVRVRQFMEAEVAPIIVDYYEKAAFPYELVPKLAGLNLAGGTIKGYGCPGLSVTELAMGVVEMARVDASLSTFILVHTCLAGLTIGLMGSEEQKLEWLPAMAQLEKIGCWGLTEPSNGSDASALTATARRVPGGWRINGQKRWIGNGTWADVAVIWARNEETRQVNAFIVRKGAPGFTTTKIENKIALRCVQNANMFFEDVFVPDADRLPGVSSFQDTNKVLAISRIMVAWQPVGICMGVYDMCVRYARERQQFGRPIAAFQLTQERLSRMAGTVQAMFLMTLRLSQLNQNGAMSHGQASLVKAWNTAQARQVVSLGREILGGNGVVTDYLVGKAFGDCEAIYTYEGTYDINSLVAGRDITGISAFRAR